MTKHSRGRKKAAREAERVMLFRPRDDGPRPRATLFTAPRPSLWETDGALWLFENTPLATEEGE